MTLAQTCPFCGKETTLYVDDKTYELYSLGMGTLDDFKDLDDFGREFVKTGMCYSCQEKTFHKPLPEHATAWGEQIGECEVCGCPIYENEDLNEIGQHVCPQCGDIFDQT